MVCDHCGAVFENAKFCPRCGAKTGLVADVAKAPVQGMKQAKTDSQVAPALNVATQPDAPESAYLGVAPLAPPVGDDTSGDREQPKPCFCAKCGKKLQPVEKFCPVCGTPAGQSPAPSISAQAPQQNPTESLKMWASSIAPETVRLTSGIVITILSAILLLQAALAETNDNVLGFLEQYTIMKMFFLALLLVAVGVAVIVLKDKPAVQPRLAYATMVLGVMTIIGLDDYFTQVIPGILLYLAMGALILESERFGNRKNESNKM